MFEPGVLTFQEFMMNEPLPLVAIHQAVLDFLRDREDVVVFGAQAVNAYVPEPRMTQDIDLLSTRAAEFVHELREHLSQRFHIAVRVRQVSEGRGYRLFQVRKSGNRHLVDVRSIETLPATQRIARVLVMAPADLIASKVISYTQRRGNPKSGTDWRDLAMLLLAFPELKHERGLVAERLVSADADQTVLATWRELVAQDIQPANEDDEF
jgi:Nucleotidyl transferase AbiEii toxin, Type IV TA system